MSGVTVKVEGVSDLREQFALLKASTQRTVIRRALAAGGEAVRAEAERLAPFDPTEDNQPHLKDNIIAKVRVTGDEQSVTIGYDKKTFWGGFVETGTQHQAAHPFLRPALDTRAADALSALGAVIVEQVNKAVRRKRSRKDG